MFFSVLLPKSCYTPGRPMGATFSAIKILIPGKPARALAPEGNQHGSMAQRSLAASASI